MSRSKSRKLKAMFQIELHPITIDRVRVGACDHSLSSSVSAKNLVENGSALLGYSHVQGLPTSTVYKEECLSVRYAFSLCNS